MPSTDKVPNKKSASALVNPPKLGLVGQSHQASLARAIPTVMTVADTHVFPATATALDTLHSNVFLYKNAPVNQPVRSHELTRMTALVPAVEMAGAYGTYPREGRTLTPLKALPACCDTSYQTGMDVDMASWVAVSGSMAAAMAESLDAMALAMRSLRK